MIDISHFFSHFPLFRYDSMCAFQNSLRLAKCMHLLRNDTIIMMLLAIRNWKLSTQAKQEIKKSN